MKVRYIHAKFSTSNTPCFFFQEPEFSNSTVISVYMNNVRLQHNENVSECNVFSCSLIIIMLIIGRGFSLLIGRNIFIMSHVIYIGNVKYEVTGV